MEVFAALTKYAQFIIYKLVPIDDKRTDKIPINPQTRKNIDPYNDYNWMHSDEAIKHSERLGSGYGVGFILTDKDPFFFLDIDHCLNPDNTWSELAKQLLNEFPGAAVEVSQSETGLHIIGHGKKEPHRCKNKPLDIELYTESRIISLTGIYARGDAGLNFDNQLSSLVARYFKPKANDSEQFEWTTEPVKEWNGEEDDDKLIKRALKSRSAAIFKNKCTFKQLWQCDEDALSETYPDHHGSRAYDESSADAALILHLSFWTGKNCQRIYDLLWKSSLVRDKWDRNDYLKRSIVNGVSLDGAVYSRGSNVEKKFNTELPQGLSIREGDARMTVEAQLEFFNGCVYVKRPNHIFTGKGELLSQDAFNWEYGGHIFELDSQDMTKTTTKAWDAMKNSFTLSWAKVTGTCFKTDMELGEILVSEGRELVNTYLEIKTERIQGDPAPFLDLIKKLLPSERDQNILLSYMAACVQYKGTKFRYAPVLQGVEGNGKTFISQCLKHAIGARYTHFPVTNDLKSTFNVWISERLLICVEEFYAPGNRNEIIENLKVLISNEDVGVQPKGVDQYTTDNCANFIFTTQYVDAIRKTKDNRRFVVFYTAQQTNDDLIRDGMDHVYFNNLKKWMKNQGYAIVNEMLCTYDIPNEFNPTMLARAPDSSMVSEVISNSRGTVEHEIVEAVSEGKTGFSNGWISSMALDRFLKDKNLSRRMPRNKRKDMLKSLGYVMHPNLRDGRVNDVIGIDAGKPRLFIEEGHQAINLVGSSEIAKAYQNAQNPTINQAPFQVINT